MARHTVKPYRHPLRAIGFLDPGYPLRCFRDDIAWCSGQPTNLAYMDKRIGLISE
jgi:hypothetical protein